MLSAHHLRVTRRGGFSLEIDSLELLPGLTVVVGPNGAGKSTLLECLTGAHANRVGSLNWNGQALNRKHGDYARVGYVPQSLAIPKRWFVRDYLEYAGWLKAIPRGELAKRARECACLLGLEQRLDMRISRLSGGLQRRTLIAQSMISDPKLLVMDEPFSGLDSQAGHRIIDVIVQSAPGRIILVADHSGSLAGLAHREIRLSDGQILA